MSSSQLWFSRQGNDLRVNIIGGSDAMTVSDWYLGTDRQMERFVAGDGKALLNSQVDSLVQAMASFTVPVSGQITLPPNYSTALAPVITANWH